MGTRLYPNTKNAANLERLAGVAPGTMAQLKALQERYNTNGATTHAEWERRYEEQYRAIHDNPNHDIATLDHFLAFGWGKFWGGDIVKECYGSLDDMAQCQRLLDMNSLHEVDLSLCEGLHWG